MNDKIRYDLYDWRKAACTYARNKITMHAERSVWKRIDREAVEAIIIRVGYTFRIAFAEDKALWITR